MLHGNEMYYVGHCSQGCLQEFGREILQEERCR